MFWAKHEEWLPRVLLLVPQYLQWIFLAGTGAWAGTWAGTCAEAGTGTGAEAGAEAGVGVGEEMLARSGAGDDSGKPNSASGDEAGK